MHQNKILIDEKPLYNYIQKDSSSNNDKNWYFL